MTILCIETSTSVCSAAICKDGKPVRQCICRQGSNHARLLPRYIEELLSLAREQNLSIDAVALSEGPGSYTGLRIGTSTAKGLCYGLNVPLVPVPTLQVLCAHAFSSLPSDKATTPVVLCPMIDARRMEVYTAFYSPDRQPLSGVRAVVVESETSLLDLQGSNVQCTKEYYYFGDGAAKCMDVLTKPNWHYLPDIVPEAQYMGLLAESNQQSAISNQQLAYYEPFYLKEFAAAQSHVKGLK